MIIAVDFDGTLCSDCYPDIGMANTKLIRTLRKKQELGDKLILWTCRAGDKLEEAIEWCREQGLLFDAINDNLPEMIALWGSNSRKITADIYLDDKAETPWEMIMDKAV